MIASEVHKKAQEQTDTEDRFASATGLLQRLSADGKLRGPCSLRDEELVEMLHHMMRIRRIDERMMLRQRQGKIGFYGTSTGQEATPTAAAMAIEASDWVFPALREGSMMLVRGFPLSTWLAQVYGNGADILKGRQMPSHMSGKSVNQVSWGSCLGPQLPQAVGAAWAAKIKKDPMVSLAFLGEGTSSEPDFHTAMNFAAVYKAPCVIICQNNHWAISVPSSKQTASETFAIKAHAYGMPGVRVDGNDVIAMHEAIKNAVDRARRGEGPTFIEALTYRIGAHSSSDDPSVYRSDEEVEMWKKRDPIERLQCYLLDRDVVRPADIEAQAARIDEEISAALKVAEAGGELQRESLFDDVFEDRPWHLQEQASELLSHPKAPSH